MVLNVSVRSVLQSFFEHTIFLELSITFYASYRIDRAVTNQNIYLLGAIVNISGIMVNSNVSLKKVNNKLVIEPLKNAFIGKDINFRICSYYSNVLS